MKDPDRTKSQLIGELMELRQRTAGLEKLEAEHKLTEESLKESEERFRELYDEAPVGYHEYDLEGRITNVNRTDLEILGYTREEMVGEFIWKFHIEEKIAHQQILAKLSGTLPPGRSLERIYRRKDGTTFPALFEDRLIQDEKGQIKGIRCTIQDITKRKQMEEALQKAHDELEERVKERTLQLSQEVEVRKRAEEALRTEKQRVEALSANAPFGMVMIEKDGTFGYINPKFRELFGYDLKDVPNGKAWFRKAFPDPTYRYEVISTWVKDLEISKTGENRSRTFTVTCKDGTEKMINFIPVQLEMGENLMSCEDITDRRHAEEALRESEERYRNILDNIEDGYYEVDIGGKFAFFSNSLCKILGYSKEEMMGMNNRQYMDEETAKKVYQTFNQVYTTGEPNTAFDYKIIRKDGTERFLETPISLIRNAEGERVGFRGIARDITERKRAEEEREKLILELQDAINKVKTLSGMLPICTSCKKIRDDKGYWNQIESYIRDHSEAEFTHGICPECMKKLYPDFADGKK